MKITWYGQSCFQISDSKYSIVTDLFQPELGLKVPTLSADILTISHDHYDHNNRQVAGNPHIVDCPGEYEIKNILISGVTAPHDQTGGKDRGKITIFIYKVGNFRLCHLSDLGDKLDEKTLEKIGDIDILFIPVGGKFTLDAKQAKEVIEQIEPKVIIPMHYGLPGQKTELAEVGSFLKEMGLDHVDPLPELDVEKLNMSSERTTVVVLQAQQS